MYSLKENDKEIGNEKMSIEDKTDKKIRLEKEKTKYGK